MVVTRSNNALSLDNYCHSIINSSCCFQATIKQLTEKLQSLEYTSSDYERQCNKMRLDNEKLEKDISEATEKYEQMEQQVMQCLQELSDI